MLAMMAQGATFYARLRGAVNYVTLIPALLFFISLGLPRRFERAVGYAAVGLGCLLAAATFLFGDSPHYERINSIAVISASGFFLIRFMASDSAESIAPEAADFAVIRWGLLIFVGLVVSQNSAQFFHTSLPLLEPFGFAAFLSTLGYVAARSTLRRDRQLKAIQKELEVARRIQLSILPREFPPSTNFRVAARYMPMTSPIDFARQTRSGLTPVNPIAPDGPTVRPVFTSSKVSSDPSRWRNPSNPRGTPLRGG